MIRRRREAEDLSGVVSDETRGSLIPKSVRERTEFQPTPPPLPWAETEIRRPCLHIPHLQHPDTDGFTDATPQCSRTHGAAEVRVRDQNRPAASAGPLGGPVTEVVGLPLDFEGVVLGHQAFFRTYAELHLGSRSTAEAVVRPVRADQGLHP